MPGKKTRLLIVNDDGQGITHPEEIRLRSVGDPVSNLRGTYRGMDSEGGKGTPVTVESPGPQAAVLF